jgi:hypothetical protein
MAAEKRTSGAEATKERTKVPEAFAENLSHGDLLGG